MYLVQVPVLDPHFFFGNCGVWYIVWIFLRPCYFCSSCLTEQKRKEESEGGGDIEEGSRHTEGSDWKVGNDE